MVNRFAAILFLFVLLPAVFAESDQDPHMASYASAIVREQGTVSVSVGQIKDLEVNISVPTSTPYQSTAIQSGDRVNYDGNGNPSVKISETSPPNPFTYSKTIAVETSARSTPSLPASYTIPADYAAYVQPTSRTQSDDDAIRTLAEKITQNATTQFEKVALLAIYVNRHTVYRPELVGQEKDALWVLQNQQGVCVEFSTLFAALARSIGIPTRYVVGYAYTDKYNAWLGHAWSEVYLGQWVPVDPTWLEVGFTDALHIETSKYPELQRDSPLVAHVTSQSARLNWDRVGRSGANADNIATQSISYFEPRADFEFQAEPQTIPPGWKTAVTLSVEGKDYRVVPVILASCRGDGALGIDEGEKYLILEPGKTSTVSWEVSSPDYFPANYAYITCPLTLNSYYLERKTVEITTKPGAPRIRANASLPGQNSGTIGQRFAWELPRPVPKSAEPLPEPPSEAELPSSPSCPLALALMMPVLLIALLKR